MGIIKAVKLAFDYLKYDEDGNVQETQRAVDGVDIDIKEGQFVAILGHNGSGKSTFAKHINALLLPSDHRNCCGGGCRIRARKHGSSDRGYLEACQRKS